MVEELLQWRKRAWKKNKGGMSYGRWVMREEGGEGERGEGEGVRKADNK